MLALLTWMTSFRVAMTRRWLTPVAGVIRSRLLKKATTLKKISIHPLDRSCGLSPRQQHLQNRYRGDT